MRFTGTELIQVATSVLVTSVVVLLVAMNRPGIAAAGSGGLEGSVNAIGGVIHARYDSRDDFLVVTVADTMTAKQATTLGCQRILPMITEAGAVTLFAIYTESDRIIASWIGCE